MRLNDIPQTADRLRCSERHVHNLIKAGRLKPADIAIGPRSKTRISDAEIDRFITDATRTIPRSDTAA